VSSGIQVACRCCLLVVLALAVAPCAGKAQEEHGHSQPRSKVHVLPSQLSYRADSMSVISRSPCKNRERLHRLGCCRSIG